MIDIKDLRIGNLVYVHDTDTIDIIDCIDCNILHTKQFSSLEYRDIHPIPITDEWLVKFGFNRDEFDSYENESRFHIYDKDKSNFICMWGVTTIGHLKYVNQLQNLYHSLTQTEINHESNTI